MFEPKERISTASPSSCSWTTKLKLLRSPDFGALMNLQPSCTHRRATIKQLAPRPLLAPLYPKVPCYLGSLPSPACPVPLDHQAGSRHLKLTPRAITWSGAIFIDTGCRTYRCRARQLIPQVSYLTEYRVLTCENTWNRNYCAMYLTHHYLPTYSLYRVPGVHMPISTPAYRCPLHIIARDLARTSQEPA